LLGLPRPPSFRVAMPCVLAGALTSAVLCEWFARTRNDVTLEPTGYGLALVLAWLLVAALTGMCRWRSGKRLRA
jgi:hypothetical protein